MNPEPVIRNFTPADLNACTAIFNSNTPKFFAPWEGPEFIKWLNLENKRAADGLYQIMELNGEIIACGGIYVDEQAKEVGLAWGMVRNDLHGRGYGTILTQYRVHKMITGYAHLKSILRTSQHTFSFYEKLGFRVIEVTPNGWDKGLDRYVMEYHPG